MTGNDRLTVAARRLRVAIDKALHELGVPDGSYPAPVANAVRILQDALGGDGLGGGEVFDGCVMDSTWREPCGKPTVSDVPGEPGYPWCNEHLPASEGGDPGA